MASSEELPFEYRMMDAVTQNFNIENIKALLDHMVNRVDDGYILHLLYISANYRRFDVFSYINDKYNYCDDYYNNYYDSLNDNLGEHGELMLGVVMGVYNALMGNV